MPIDRTKITTKENRIRREDSKSRQKNEKTSKRSPTVDRSNKRMTVNNEESSKIKTDKYRSSSVDRHPNKTKTRDDSRIRKSVSKERVEKSVTGSSRYSQQFGESSNLERQRKSSQRQSTERIYKNINSKDDKARSNKSQRHSNPDSEKYKSSFDSKYVRNDHSSRNRTHKLKEEPKKKNEEHKKSNTRKEKSLKIEAKTPEGREKSEIIHQEKKHQLSQLPETFVKENKSSNKLEISAKENIGDNDYNYEDDFEEYESDFEDDDDDGDDKAESEKVNSEMEDYDINDDKIDTLTKENEYEPKLKTEQENPYNSLKRSEKYKNYEEQPYGNDWEIPKKVSQFQNYTRTFINFKSIQKQQERKSASTKLKKRGTELLEIITLDQITFDLFEMPPVKYDVYIRCFGRSNTKQVFVQTDYGHDEEIQTNEMNSREKWTQIPPNDHLGFGGDLEENNFKNITWNSRKKIDAIYLNKFIQNTSQIILNILDEELTEISLQKLSENYTNINISQGFIHLGSLSILSESPVTYLHFSDIKTCFLLSIHSTLANQNISNSYLKEKGIICLWNINQPSQPERILASSGQPSCCCFGPENIVIAGMIDGSIALWDLQEHTSWHPRIYLDEKEWIVRTPTYSTATVLKEEGHHSCIVAIKILPYSSSSEILSPSKKKSNSGRNFHVISLEDLSVIHIWIVMEIAKYDTSNIEGDLGLAPWGKVKLIKSSSIKLYNLYGLGDIMKFGVRSFDFQMIPSNPSHMLVTTDTGAVIHCTRFNSKINPRLYTSNSELFIEARCIDFSPHDIPVFLIGCDDGSIRLHNIHLERPLLSWSDATNGKPIKQIKWSSCQPAMFFVVDTDSSIYIWDLSQNISNPIEVCESLQNRISFLCFSFNSEANSEKYSGWPPHVAIARENGILEIHQLSKKFSVLSQQQYEKQKQVLLHL